MELEETLNSNWGNFETWKQSQAQDKCAFKETNKQNSYILKGSNDGV
jgi:hypothetical protein